jgi:hypothetical protein
VAKTKLVEPRFGKRTERDCAESQSQRVAGRAVQKKQRPAN